MAETNVSCYGPMLLCWGPCLLWLLPRPVSAHLYGYTVCLVWLLAFLCGPVSVESTLPNCLSFLNALHLVGSSVIHAVPASCTSG
eukprot:contig_42077_g9537